MVAPLKEDPIVVVCGADNNYAMPLATMLCSVMANHQQGHRVEIFIIDGGIEARNRQKILDSLNQYQVTLHWVRPDEGNSKNLMTSGYITYATYYKILIPVLLP
ncbi:MAG: glycosyltransferase, partial [Leptolyngbyaceae cyanobacterium bins.59]|nr:glycosyltransferase [Leptolyngbyaceae cyanobacterium bins.59]